MTLQELLNFYDFDYKHYIDGYGLIDLQKADLGRIEDERYEDPQDLVIRLRESNYFDDYILSNLTDRYGEINYLVNFAKEHKEDEPELYYTLNPEMLDNLPPVLYNALDAYNIAKSKAEEFLLNHIKEKGYTDYFIDDNISIETPHTLKATCFHSKEEKEDFINGRNIIGKVFHGEYVNINHFLEESNKELNKIVSLQYDTAIYSDEKNWIENGKPIFYGEVRVDDKSEYNFVIHANEVEQELKLPSNTITFDTVKDYLNSLKNITSHISHYIDFDYLNLLTLKQKEPEESENIELM